MRFFLLKDFMKLFLLFSLALTSAYAQNLETYFEYMKNNPETMGRLGDADSGEIQIVLDKQEIAEVEKKSGRKVGIEVDDRYWIWVNDAVKFPNGRLGFFPRIVFRATLEGHHGVAVLPILPSGKIVLNRMFRHATRSWEYEIPRGGIEAGETVLQGAAREVQEETGMIIDHLVFLGYMNGDTGITNLSVPVYLGQVIGQQDAQHTDTEAIAGVDAFTFEELKQGLIKGYLTTDRGGKSCQVRLRDPFLTFALLQADYRGLLRKN